MKKQAESWLSAAKDDLDVIKEISGNRFTPYRQTFT